MSKLFNLSIEDKLATTHFEVDDTAHIRIKDQKLCQKCEKKPCQKACPAKLYEWNEEAQEMMYNYEGCLECGTCLLICPHDNILWSYPKGAKGVVYRFG